MSKVKSTKSKSVDNTLCFYCNEKLGEESWLIPFDVPYVNIYIHKDCKNKYLSERDEFLKENTARVKEYADKYGRHGVESPKATAPKSKGKSKKKSKKQEKSKK